jgi:hypothetical protein
MSMAKQTKKQGKKPVPGNPPNPTHRTIKKK